ncbi:unnamed protein product [Camellia sinensis]
MEQSFFNLIYFLHCPGLAETFLDVLFSSVPIWLTVMIGLVIGWSWRPSCRLPNNKRLNLEAVGAELDEMGAVKVDEFSRTNIPNIWAVGDVTNRLNLTPVALMEGTCFSKTVFGGQPTKPDYNNVPCAVFCIPPLCVVGLSEEEAIEQAKGDVSIFTSTFNHMKNTVSGRQEKTVMKLVVDSEIDKVIGASMCGPDAPEIMQVLYLCRQSGHWGVINVVGAMTLTHREIARTFREKGIPCDVIWMDIDYMNGFRCFTFDQERVPDPKSLVKDLHLTGFKATEKWKKCIGDKDGEVELQVNKTQKQLLPVRRGTNGGVTKAGLLAAAVAGSIIELTFVFIGFFTTRCAYDVALKQLLVIPISALAGLCGSVIDSLLGATLQFSGFCSVCNKVAYTNSTINLVGDDHPLPAVAEVGLSLRCSFPSTIVLIADEPVNKLDVIWSAIQADRGPGQVRATPITVANGRTIRVSSVCISDSGKAFGNSSVLHLSWELSNCDGLASWGDAYDLATSKSTWERFLLLQNASGLCIVRATVFGFSDNMVDDHSTAPFENLESNLTDAVCLQMHVHLKRHLMKDLPETDDAVAQWCRDMFVAKVSLRASMEGFLDAFNPKDSVAKDAETIKNESLSINKDPKCVELLINADKDKLQAQLTKDIPLDFQKKIIIAKHEKQEANSDIFLGKK